MLIDVWICVDNEWWSHLLEKQAPVNCCTFINRSRVCWGHSSCTGNPLAEGSSLQARSHRPLTLAPEYGQPRCCLTHAQSRRQQSDETHRHLASFYSLTCRRKTRQGSIHADGQDDH